jgi:hypothetical protein
MNIIEHCGTIMTTKHNKQRIIQYTIKVEPHILKHANLTFVHIIIPGGMTPTSRRSFATSCSHSPRSLFYTHISITTTTTTTTTSVVCTGVINVHVVVDTRIVAAKQNKHALTDKSGRMTRTRRWHTSRYCRRRPRSALCRQTHSPSAKCVGRLHRQPIVFETRVAVIFVFFIIDIDFDVLLTDRSRFFSS